MEASRDPSDSRTGSQRKTPEQVRAGVMKTKALVPRRSRSLCPDGMQDRGSSIVPENKKLHLSVPSFSGNLYPPTGKHPKMSTKLVGRGRGSGLGVGDQSSFVSSHSV